MGGLEATEKLYFYRWSLQKATCIKGLNEQAYGSIQAESCKAIPADRNFVVLHRLVFSDKSHLMREGLGNQQEVKRIFVIWG